MSTRVSAVAPAAAASSAPGWERRFSAVREREDLLDEAPIAPADQGPLLARKLAHYVALSRLEREALAKTLSLDVRRVRRRTTLYEHGETATKLAVMLAGWACRYKVALGGRRQVVAFYLPGDVCDFSILMTPELDSTVELIDRAEIAGLSRGQLAALSRNQPRIVRAMWRDAQSASSIQREWIFNIAQRNAIERTAHMLSEIVARLDAVGQFDRDGSCDLPITQADFGDACGMTPEHTNRCLRELRDAGLAIWRGGRLSVPDPKRLARVSGFDPYYLQLKPLHFDEPLNI
jgi:CRP-like cAMP-binding protein